MHKNFFLFEQLIREIKAQILGKHIGLPFTFQKDELIFPLDDQQFLRISVSADHPYILLSPAKHIRQPVLEFFPETEGQPILDMRLKSFDKHAIIELNDFRLEALFYAPYYNVFLFTPDDRLKAQFKDKNEYPLAEEPPASPLILSDLSPAEVQTRLQSESQKTLQSFFKKNFIALNNVFLNEIFYRLDMPKEQAISRISPAQKDKITKTLVQIGDELNDGKSYLYFRNEHIERIAVLRLTYLETDSAVRFRSFDSLNAAREISRFVYYLLQGRVGIRRRGLTSKVDRFYAFVLEEAISQLGSRIINPTDSFCMDPYLFSVIDSRGRVKGKFDGFTYGETKEIVKIMKYHLKRERNSKGRLRMSKGLVKIASLGIRKRYVIARGLGFILGEGIFRGFNTGKVKYSDIVKLITYNI